MSDETVRAALRSDLPLVVVESPAGCGKTHQGADYARDVAANGRPGRLLILTHTHAACSVFADRTKGTGSRVEIRTLDSVISLIASAYHAGLGLPADVAAWVRQDPVRRYPELGFKVATLLTRYPMIAASLAQRHATVVCDEYQDSSADQHSVVTSLLNEGAWLRIFADPMQKIFKDRTEAGACTPCDWNDLMRRAHAFEELDVPHRWSSGCPELGKWTLTVRNTLKNGGTVDLRQQLPSSLEIVFAENQAPRRMQYRLHPEDRRPIDSFVRQQASLLILTHHNDTARSLCSFFGGRIELWEGHSRSSLDKLANKLRDAEGNSLALTDAVLRFMRNVASGFSSSAFGNRLEQEVRDGCIADCRGKPAKIQELGRILLAEPNHKGVGKMLRRLHEFSQSDPAFEDVNVDHYKEFWDVIRLAEFDTVDDGLAEITHRRTYSHPKPPAKAISTIHKAKGLECESVILMPCDATTFPDTPYARCLVYVALSRAKNRLLLVLSRANRSPLFLFN